MKPGDTFETAIWLDGTEPEELKERFVKDCLNQLKETKLLFGPLRLTEKKVWEDQVPEPPSSLQGPDVRLLVVEADVIGIRPVTESRFVEDLDEKDLQRLRTILRKVHKSYGNISELSDEKCDEFININGPDAALEVLRERVGKTIH